MTPSSRIPALILSVAAMAATARPVRAQSPIVRFGDRIMLYSHGNQGIEARVLDASADSVWYLADQGTYARMAIARDQVDSVTIHVAQPVHRGHRALAGFAIGAATGAAAWVGYVGHASEGCHDGPCGVAIIFTPVAALAGGVVGVATSQIHVGSDDWVLGVLPTAGSAK